MHESIACLDIGPQLLCRRSSFCQQPMQLVEWRWQSLFLSNPLQGSHNEGESLGQFETRSRERGISIVSQSASDRKAIFPRNHCFLILLLLSFPLNRTNAAYLLFQFFLRVAICLIDRFRRFAEIMKVTQLMRNLWKRRSDSVANGMLTIRNDSMNGNRERILYFASAVSPSRPRDSFAEVGQAESHLSVNACVMLAHATCW